jgi:hypothetical protein
MHKIGLMAILLALFVIGCSNTVSTGQTASPQLIFILEGSGDPDVGMSAKATESFHVSKTEWFIETNCEALDSSNSVGLLVSVFPKGKSIDGSYIGVVNQNNPGLDKNYFYGTGDFYLTIVAMNVKAWTIKVYQ